MFSSFGKINDIRMPIDRATGKLKGFSFITYAREVDAKTALA